MASYSLFSSTFFIPPPSPGHGRNTEETRRMTFPAAFDPFRDIYTDNTLLHGHQYSGDRLEQPMENMLSSAVVATAVC